MCNGFISATTEFNNCFLFVCKHFFQDRWTFSLKPFVFSPLQQKPHKLADIISCYIVFSIYDKMTHNVVYLFSIYHGEVITPNLGNYQADLTISPSALNQSKLLKYFQYIKNKIYSLATTRIYGLKHSFYAIKFSRELLLTKKEIHEHYVLWIEIIRLSVYMITHQNGSHLFLQSVSEFTT